MRCSTCSKSALVEIRMRIGSVGRDVPTLWSLRDPGVGDRRGPDRPVRRARPRPRDRLDEPTWPRPGLTGRPTDPGAKLGAHGRTDLCHRRARAPPATGLRRRLARVLPAGPTDRPWYERVELWAGLAVVAACALFVFLQHQPHLLLRNTTTAGGDTGAHVWWPAYLRDHLLPHWRLAGWTPRLLRRLPRGPVLLPAPGAADRRPRRRRAVQRRVQARHRGRPGPAPGRRVRVRPGPALPSPGAADDGASARRPSSSSPGAPGTARRRPPRRSTSGSWAGRWPATWRGSSRSRSRSPSRSCSSARSRGASTTARAPPPLVAAGGAAGGDGAQPPGRRRVRGRGRAGRLGRAPPDPHLSPRVARSARSARCSPRSGPCRSWRRSGTRPTWGTRRSTTTSTTSFRRTSGTSTSPPRSPWSWR